MIFIFLADRSRGTGKILKEDREELKVLGLPVQVIRHQEQWYLRLPHELKADRKNPLQEGRSLRISHTVRQEHADLYVLSVPQGYGTYVRCHYPRRPFTIGSSLQDDIFLDLPILREAAWYIDPGKRLIRKKEGLLLGSLNEELITDEAAFQSGDIFCCLYLRIVFHDEFLMINSLFPLRECFVRRMPGRKDVLLPSRGMLKVHHDRPKEEKAEVICRLKLPQMPEEGFTSQLLLAMAPALMMSSASLLSGSLNAYRGYMAGRSFIEVLPGILLPGVMLLSALLWNPLQRRYEKKQRRKKKQKILDRFKAETDAFIAEMQQQNRLYGEYAEAVTMLPQMYEENFMQEHLFYLHDDAAVILYLGCGSHILAIHHEQELHSDEKEITEVLTGIDEAYEAIDDTAALFDLSQYRRIVIEGDYEQLFLHILHTVRYLYPRVSICIFCPQEERKDRYVLRECASFGADGRRMLFDSEEELHESVHDPSFAQQNVIILAFHLKDDIDPGIDCMTVYFEKDEFRHRCLLRVKADGNDLHMEDLLMHRDLHTRMESIPDRDLIMKIRNPAQKEWQGMSAGSGFLAMLKAENIAQLKISQRWQMNEKEESLKCVIGTDREGNRIVLDLDETGQGPHGLLAGTTGSGKSELLLSMIMSLAVSYSPRRLQFAIIDFKGGNSFQALMREGCRLPHLTALLSDLDAEDMKRALFCLRDLLRQREMLFREMGSRKNVPVRNLKDYRRHHRDGEGIPELADVVLIVDEFAELKRERPDFLEELVRIARLGRSLGLHLILATQKPGGIITDQIWSNTRFRICLKVSEKQDSAEMIRSPDALYLKDPGSFILCVDEKMQKGRCGYLHQPYETAHRTVCILNEKGTVEKESDRDKESSESEFSAVMQEILSLSPDTAAAMWTAVLPDLHVYDDLWQPGLLGLADDYEHQVYRAIESQHEETCFHAVLSPEPAETASFIRSLIFARLYGQRENEECYLIDDMKIIQPESAEKSRLLNNCLKTADEERNTNLFRRLLQDDGIARTVIISDLAALYQSSEDYRMQLRRIMNHCAGRHLDLWFFCRTSSALSYQEASLMHEIWCLRNDSANEIQSFLQLPWKGRLHRSGHGLCRREDLLECAWFQIDDELLHDELKAAKTAGNIFRLPYMKEVIDASDYTGEGIPLGILHESYEWYAADENTVIVFVYEDECESLKAYLRENSCISFCRYEEWRMDPSAFRKKDVILIGEAAEDHLRCRHRSRRPEEGEGLLLRNGKSEVLRFVKM